MIEERANRSFDEGESKIKSFILIKPRALKCGENSKSHIKVIHFKIYLKTLSKHVFKEKYYL